MALGAADAERLGDDQEAPVVGVDRLYGAYSKIAV